MDAPRYALSDGHHLAYRVTDNVEPRDVVLFTPGGTIEIELISAPGNSAAGACAVLRVRDTGTGIPPEDMGHIFNRFYRGDKSRQREKQNRGTGLGLSICKSIVASHGGHIDVESSVGRGTTFTVVLPLVPKRDGHMLPVIDEPSMAEYEHAAEIHRA